MSDLSNKIIKGVKTGFDLLQNPNEIRLIRQSNKIWRNGCLTDYPTFSHLPVVSIHQFLAAGADCVDPYYFLGDGSTLMDLLLLNNLAKSIPGTKYFEIGIWRGESILNVAKYAEECVGLDLPDDYYLSQEDLAGLVLERNELLDKNSKIVRLEGDSKHFDFSKISGKFDLIFIDGNHAYDFVKADTHNVFQNLVTDNGIIVWHDYGFTPEDVRYEVLKGILDGLPHDEHKNLYHVSHTKCAIWTKRKIDSSMNDGISFPMVGHAPFSVKVNF